MGIRNEITEEQITNLMRAIPRAEEVDRLREENKLLRAEIERLRATNKQLVEGIDTITRRKQEEIERLREALKDMLNGWRYIRETYGDFYGVGWDRAEQKALYALEDKP